MRAWRKVHPDRYTYRVKIRKRIAMRVRRGTLIRLPCEVCGAARVEAHHESYARPDEVRWLCPPHHREADRARRKRITGG